MTRPGGTRLANYGVVYKKPYEHPKCRACGEPIDPPRGPSGMPYKKCLSCLTKVPGRNKAYYRRHREAAGKVD